MNELPHWALLPAGLHDVLPPDAAHEATVVEQVMAILAGHGYERVKPPLIEFEESLLSGPGAAMAGETFRLMDPISQRMMGLRADMTPQIARIAGARLANQARPLRLAYAGQVLRVRGNQLRPERQFGQVGAELIGVSAPATDAEIAAIAAECLGAVGIDRLSLDLNHPQLVSALLEELQVSDQQAQRLRRALDRKDAAAVAAESGAAADLLGRLLAAGGPAATAVPAAEALQLPANAAARLDRLLAAVRTVAAVMADLTVTVDFVEHRGFEYHSGVSFTLFARGVRGELGRGGRYRVDTAEGGNGEDATGFSLYLDTVLRAAKPSPQRRRVFVPIGTPSAEAARLRADGWATVAGLAECDPQTEARRTQCDAAYVDGKVRALD